MFIYYHFVLLLKILIVIEFNVACVCPYFYFSCLFVLYTCVAINLFQILTVIGFNVAFLCPHFYFLLLIRFMHIRCN